MIVKRVAVGVDLAVVASPLMRMEEKLRTMEKKSQV
jgi:hypothetical protein